MVISCSVVGTKYSDVQIVYNKSTSVRSSQEVLSKGGISFYSVRLMLDADDQVAFGAGEQE
jgi:hypothetical protein